MLDVTLRTLHVAAVVIYLGGGIFFHGPLRRALKLIPPGQASIIGSKVGADFTYISWLSLVVWGVTGYWMLFRFGWGDASAPLSLFVNPVFLETAEGIWLLVMLAAWYLIVINGLIISFRYRPRLAQRVPAGGSAAEADQVANTISIAASRVDVLALANLVLTIVGLVSGGIFF